MAAEPRTPALTAEQARKLLRYEPETGRLFWRERPRELCPSDGDWKRWNKRFCGTEAFTASNGIGYRQGHVLGALYKAHRIIWLMHTGEWPDADIDHINGLRDDNRISNLRAASRAENGRNSCMRINNTSGVPGVWWNKRYQKWQAQIGVKGAVKYLGRFDNLEDAKSARARANSQHGFSLRHGAPKSP